MDAQAYSHGVLEEMGESPHEVEKFANVRHFQQ